MKFRLLNNNRFSFLEWKTDEKNICWPIRFSAIVHLQKVPITVSSDNLPDSQSSTYRQNSNKTFKCSYLKKNTRYLIFFNQILVNTLKYWENWKICVFKTSEKMLVWCNIIFAILSWFLWTKPMRSFLFKRLLYKK